MVLRGEAGVGKTALVEHLVGRAPDFTVARAAGVESEMELAFAGVHQLCVPMMGHLGRLPDPQREALAIAFGLSTGDPPDRFLVGLAVLSLLAEVDEEQPLLCVVDDAQWLDRVSAQTLAFVARRLLAERVAMVFAMRGPTIGPDDDQLVGLRELVVQGLRDEDARALLESAVPGRLDERVKDRIVAETHGNPLALLELPRGLTTAELAGGFGRPDAQPLVSQIEQSFLRRIRSLPAATQRLLLAAAAEPVGDVSLLRRVAERLAIGADAAGGRGGGIDRVRYAGAVSSSAGALGGLSRGEPQRPSGRASRAGRGDRSRNRPGSPSVASRARGGGTRRGCGRRAGVFGGPGPGSGRSRSGGRLPEARDRTDARSGRPRSTGDGRSTANFDAGSPQAAHELLVAAQLGPLDELQRARSARLRAQIVFARQRGRDAVPLLVDAADRLERLGRRTGA